MYLISKITPTKKIGSYNIYLNNKYSFTISDLVLASFKLKEGIILSLSLIEQILILELTERFKNYSLSVLSSRPKSEKEVEDKLKDRSKKYKEIWPLLGLRKNNLKNANFKSKTKKSIFPSRFVHSSELQDKYTNTSVNQRNKKSSGGVIRILSLDKNKNSLPISNHQTVLSSSQRYFCLEDTVVSSIFETAKNNALEFLKKYNYLNNTDFARWLTEQRLKQGKGKLFIKQELVKKGILLDIIIDILSSIDTKSSINLVYKKALKKYLKETDKNKKKQKMCRYMVSRGFSYNEILSQLESVTEV